MTVGEIHAQAVEIGRGLDAPDDMGDEDEQRQTLNALMKAIDEEPLSPRRLPAMRLVLLQSAIQNRESKIVCRPFGDPNWVTDTAKRLGLECMVRPRGRPKKQS